MLFNNTRYIQAKSNHLTPRHACAVCVIHSSLTKPTTDPRSPTTSGYTETLQPGQTLTFELPFWEWEAPDLKDCSHLVVVRVDLVCVLRASLHLLGCWDPRPYCAAGPSTLEDTKYCKKTARIANTHFQWPHPLINFLILNKQGDKTWVLWCCSFLDFPL